MSHVARDKSRLLARVRRIRGQVEALERAISGEAACADVLHQIAGVRGAIQGLLREVMEGHIREHVAGRPGVGEAERERGAEELIEVLRRYLK